MLKLVITYYCKREIKTIVAFKSIDLYCLSTKERDSFYKEIQLLEVLSRGCNSRLINGCNYNDFWMISKRPGSETSTAPN